jgi:hypothetical protein
MSWGIWIVSSSVAYELKNITSLQFIFLNSYVILEFTVYIPQLIRHTRVYSLYSSTHTLYSSLQFIFLNSYVTLELTVYIPQLIRYTRAYSLYSSTHTLHTRIQFIFLNSYVTLELTVYKNCKLECNVWVEEYKL